MKKISILYFFIILLMNHTSHSLPFKLPSFKVDLNIPIETEKRVDEWLLRIHDELLNVKAMFEKTDSNVDTLVGHLSPEQLSRMVTQAGIALAASSTTVLSSYVLYIILRNEIQNSYLKNEKTSRTIMCLGVLNLLFLMGSITVLLYSSKIAQAYSLPLI